MFPSVWLRYTPWWGSNIAHPRSKIDMLQMGSYAREWVPDMLETTWHFYFFRIGPLTCVRWPYVTVGRLAMRTLYCQCISCYSKSCVHWILKFKKFIWRRILRWIRRLKNLFVKNIFDQFLVIFGKNPIFAFSMIVFLEINIFGEATTNLWCE